MRVPDGDTAWFNDSLWGFRINEMQYHEHPLIKSTTTHIKRIITRRLPWIRLFDSKTKTLQPYDCALVYILVTYICIEKQNRMDLLRTLLIYADAFFFNEKWYSLIQIEMQYLLFFIFSSTR